MGATNEAQDCHRHPELKRKLYAALQEGDEGELAIAIPKEVALKQSGHLPTGVVFSESEWHCPTKCNILLISGVYAKLPLRNPKLLASLSLRPFQSFPQLRSTLHTAFAIPSTALNLCFQLTHIPM